MQRLINWLGDTGRFLGGMFYWNLRKSLYVRRGRQGQCPCQNESDDSIPGQVRCDAMLHWHNPARFQRICPLLIQTPGGWRCSVHASAVRPFWGRVWRWLGLGAVGLYLAATLVVFAGLRLTGGAPVSWLQVAWPGKWDEIRPTQSAHLFREAIGSFQRGQVAEAHLTLSTAHQLDSGNYEAALMLAQISMFQRSYRFSDELFMTLWGQHPEQRLRTAVAYHDTLLSLDRMDKLADFSLTMAATDSGRAVIWVRSALLAVRSMSRDEAARLRTTSEGILARLAPHAQQLIRAELDARDGDEIEALAAFHRRFAGPFNVIYTQYQVERLADLGGVADAQLLLDAQGPLMGEFDHQLTQVIVSRLAHDEVQVQGSFRNILKQPLNPQRVARLCSLLIAHPDAGLFRELHERLRGDFSLWAASDVAGLWIAGIVCGAQPEAGFWREHGRKQHGVEFPAIDRLDFASRDLLAPASVSHVVNVVTFPREVILALLWRVAPQANR